MSLRARLALALALLAALAAVAVAVTGYRATDQRLRAELDQSLDVYGDRLSGSSNGRTAHILCENAAQAVGDDFDEQPGFGERRQPFQELSGAVIQCLGADGTALATTASDPLPISDADAAVATAAAGSDGPKTVSVNGRDYRVLTVGTRDAQVRAVQIARSTAENERVLSGLRTRYLLLTEVITVLAALAGWLIARAAVKPLLELTDTAEAVAASNRLDVDVPVDGRDEAGRLGRAFATMLAALRQSREQQQRLVQDAGHELRTPLTSLRANVDALERYPDLDPDRRSQILADLDSELRELTTLTNELVSLAIDPDDDEPVGPVDLVAVATHSIERAQRRSGRSIDADLHACVVNGRERQIGRAIDNLLDNALKFSPDDAPVRIVVEQATVTVSDGGPGIAPGDLPHVFERFYRSPQARSAPGSGLGLAIVADIAQRHGGRVSADNGADGGAVLAISFPTG